MTTTVCTHPGCTNPVDVPGSFTGMLLDRLVKVAACDAHLPPEPETPVESSAPTVMSTWRSRVPSEIVRFYEGAPTLDDLPDYVVGLPQLREIAEAWPGRWSPGGSPVNAIVLQGVTGALKTTTAYALVFDMVRRMDRPDLHRRKVHIATEGDLLGDTFNDRGFATPANPVRAVRGADIVVVDDVGTGLFNSDKNRTNSWWALLNEVSTRGKFLILTTNIGHERELWDHLGAAAFSRLVGLFGRTIPGGFVAPTSDNPKDRGYWPTPTLLGIQPTGTDHRMLSVGGDQR